MRSDRAPPSDRRPLAAGADGVHERPLERRKRRDRDAERSPADFVRLDVLDAGHLTILSGLLVHVLDADQVAAELVEVHTLHSEPAALRSPARHPPATCAKAAGDGRRLEAEDAGTIVREHLREAPYDGLTSAHQLAAER